MSPQDTDFNQLPLAQQLAQQFNLMCRANKTLIAQINALESKVYQLKRHAKKQENLHNAKQKQLEAQIQNLQKQLAEKETTIANLKQNQPPKQKTWNLKYRVAKMIINKYNLNEEYEAQFNAIFHPERLPEFSDVQSFNTNLKAQ